MTFKRNSCDGDDLKMPGSAKLVAQPQKFGIEKVTTIINILVFLLNYVVHQTIYSL